MSDRSVITFSAPVFKRNDLFVLALLDHFRSHFCAAGCHVPVIDVHQHFKRSHLARFDIEQIDINRVALRDAILPSASLDNCVSHKNEVFRGGKAAHTSTDGRSWQAKAVAVSTWEARPVRNSEGL